jgi:hypothetical protein
MVRAATDLELQGATAFCQLLRDSRRVRGKRRPRWRRCSTDSVRVNRPMSRKGQRTNAESITWHDVNSVFDLASLWRRARSGKLIMIHR